MSENSKREYKTVTPGRYKASALPARTADPS